LGRTVLARASSTELADDAGEDVDPFGDGLLVHAGGLEPWPSSRSR
jgi:hypothetical protein